jgi:hypothetical protein
MQFLFYYVKRLFRPKLAIDPAAYINLTVINKSVTVLTSKMLNYTDVNSSTEKLVNCF